MKPMCRRRSLASSSGERPSVGWEPTVSVPSVGVRMQPRIDSSVVLPLPEGPMSSVSSPGVERQIHALERPRLARAVPQLLDDIARVQNDVGGGRKARGDAGCDAVCDQGAGSVCAHRLNTTAGSMRITLPMADSAEMAHMATVSPSSKAASPGVMTIGRAVRSLR